MSRKELDNFLARSHKELSIQDFEGRGIPCIEFDGKKFDGILSKVEGKPLIVDTTLNILQDGFGHVFVEILLNFSHGGINENILINAQICNNGFTSQDLLSLISHFIIVLYIFDYLLHVQINNIFYNVQVYYINYMDMQ